jgi:hypothetical protein
MSSRWAWGSVAALLVCAASATAGIVDPGLEELLSNKSSTDTVSTIVFLADRVDLDALTAALDREHATLQRRHEVVVRALQDKAATTQGPVLEYLAGLQTTGNVASFQSFWIANAIRVDLPANMVRQIAQHPDVDTVYLNYAVEPVLPTNSRAAEDDHQRSPEPGLVAIHVPQVWALGFDGTGELVATMDTGVDGNHPALHNRWAFIADPNHYAGHPEWAWRDALVSPPTTFPSDGYGHGTHTMGTVCGGAPGDQVGVAPGAHWIADNTINQGTGPAFNADVIAGFQWFADPDGNPATDWDVPGSCSNSWGLTAGLGMPPCDPTYWIYLDAAEAAGVVVVFSAGNEGPGANTLRRPGDRATDDYHTTAVAAVDANTSGWPIAGFSSRGPTYCTPTGVAAIKPNIAAPGVSVRSSYPGGGYQYMDGTSMASPHVNGVIALMRQACPDLSVQQIKEIIYQTAHDLGTAGEDNSYGWGMIDALAAVNMALDVCVPKPPTAIDGSAATDMNTVVSVTLTGDDDGKPNPPGALSYVIVSLPAHGHLIDPTAGAILSVPFALSGATVQYLPGAYYIGTDSFTFIANDGGTPPDGGNSNVATISLSIAGTISQIYYYPLDTDPGWTTEGAWAFGTPTGGGSHAKDPSSGHTGADVYGYNLSGDYGNNMPVRYLTTTAINCSNITSIELRFWRRLGVEFTDYAGIDASNDGTTWVNAWNNAGVQYNDSDWVQQVVNLSSVADNHATVYVRWAMGPTDYSVTFPGWNIDDVAVWGFTIPAYATGDLNCDGQVNFGDINPFVERLSSPAQYWLTHPACPDGNGDINHDGNVNFGDINPFVALLSH